MLGYNIFSDAGREPNEYREGDVVRIIEKGSHSFRIGDVIEISKTYETAATQPEARYLGGSEVDFPYVFLHEIEPVFFVEDPSDDN